ncbi:hypothetical protein [Sutcliffiella halmapala]|uniref:hypothetical protein n=1 Tax=Sutcliffiella halmapala TaxID=79882 RepID=UPI000994C540|nr:hypothetical protein [Sutcliffiella halmapala]
MMQLLNWYCDAKKTIEIIYIAKTGTITQRKITILHTLDKSIVAYCHLRGTKRTFLLENILSFSPYTKKRKNDSAI